MTAPADKHLPERIEMFFRWFRQRRANVIALGIAHPPEFEGRKTSCIPEQYLMIGAPSMPSPTTGPRRSSPP